MKQHFFSLLLAVSTAFVFTACDTIETASAPGLVRYVDPFIGTSATGHTFPGAALPFGLIQVGPETGTGDWRYCSGYHHEDELVRGFAHTHLNGTGCSDLGDILMLPFYSSLQRDDRKALMDKSQEKATPGYYTTYLPEYKVKVELTATEHSAFHRYTYENTDSARMLLDLQSGIVWNAKALEAHVLESEINLENNLTITGYQEVKEWIRRKYFFRMEFDKPYTVLDTLPAEENNRAPRLILAFDIPQGETLHVKLGLSTVDCNGAAQSLTAEIGNRPFDEIRQLAQVKWETLLSRVNVQGSDAQKRSFYTSMYHLFLQPANIADLDGRYRGQDDSIYTAPSSDKYYSTWSLWDTYRAAHPLYTILMPEMIDDFVNSMIAHRKVKGYLPIWALWGKENYCMIGNHAIPVIADAYFKGFTGFDAEEAYEAMKTSATVSHKGSDWESYVKYGYYPFDIMTNESVSKTLECVYDDYCIAQMAKALGKNEDYKYFSDRANFYKNLFDPQTKMMRAKDSNGNWREPFNPLHLAHSESSGGDYTEGNSWQYTWHVQHDPEGLIELMGGNEPFCAKLDSLFFLEASQEETGRLADVTGLIGQYAHGNEPSHHVSYLYTIAGKPYKTQMLVREVFDRYYLDKPDGLCGNDDCGQMSAWYIFSAMGFYPLNPMGGEYILGAPQLPQISVSLPNSKTLTVKAQNLSERNKYVASVTWNGTPIDNYRIHHKDLMQGGELIFTMCEAYDYPNQ